MQLKTLLDKLNLEVSGSPAVEISALAYDSRRVTAGTLFFALPGRISQGRDFIPQALARGAVAILTDSIVPDLPVPCISAPDPRAAMAEIARRFHGDPSESLRVVGVTGTNGKTTTTFLVKHLLDDAHHRCGLIGTVRYDIGGRFLPATRTTPESTDMQELLAKMRANGCRAAAVEISSIALDERRADGIHLDVGIFTNLTQDHLDYHGTMEAYFRAKARLFELMVADKRGTAVINIDDPAGVRLVDKFSGKLPLKTFGFSLRADLRASDPRIDFGGTSYRLDAEGKSFLVRMPLIGRFNVLNSLAALSAVSALELNLREAVKSLEECPAAPGRLENVPAKKLFRVFVDYAHTPDALLNALDTLRELSPNRLICVFGCGGDRDRAKRPLMGRVAAERADFSILTSDNPRSEDPITILNEIAIAIPQASREIIPDRREAIFRAVELARPRDIVLIAGKGHESYQEFAEHTLPFDDLQVARWAIEARSAAKAAEESAEAHQSRLSRSGGSR